MVVNPRCDVWKYFINIIEEGVAVCKLCNQRLKNQRSFSLRKHITKLHNPNSVIWKYFDNNVDECVAVCKICEKRIRNNRHFNLITHLKQHDVIVEENESITRAAAYTANESRKEIDCSKQSLYITMDEKTVVGSVMGLMIDEGVTPQFFASKNIQRLLSPICDAISKKESIRFQVDELQSEQTVLAVASYIRDEFSNDLHWRLLSLRIDMDLPPNSNRFWLSVQFVNETTVESRILGEINLKSGQQLSAECIMEVLHKFNIDSRQIVSACWDNSKAKYYNSVANCDYLQEVEEFEKYPQISLSDVVKVERYIGVIVQHCTLDVLKNPTIFHLFMDCRNLTKFINEKPHIFNEVFKQKGLNIPQLDSPWRWGSTYNMMNDLKEALCVLDNITCEQPSGSPDRFSLTDELKTFIDAFCKTLDPVQKSVEKFYTSEIIYGDFYAQWLKCKLLTEKRYNTSEEGSFLSKISGEMVAIMENRSAELLNQDHFKACLYLDPRFQHTLNMPEKMFAIEYLKELWYRSKLYNTDLKDPIPEINDENTSQSGMLADDDDEFLNEFLSQSIPDTGTTGINKKLEEFKLLFQMAETNVLCYWKELKFCEPEIYILSSICFALPATQIYNKIERSDIPPSSNAVNMNSDVKESLDLIRLNQSILANAIEKLVLFREDSSDNELIDNDRTRTWHTTTAVTDDKSAAVKSVNHSEPSTSGITCNKS